MSNSQSVLSELLRAFPEGRPQLYFKSSLTALSHAMEDQVLADHQNPLIIASFQRERFYRQEAHRYRRIADRSQQVYVLAAPETDFKNNSDRYETIAFDPQDALSQEWHLVVIGKQYASCLICRERPTSAGDAIDNNRRFEGIWTFERSMSQKAADILLNRILAYRPELDAKIHQARRRYLTSPSVILAHSPQEFQSNPAPFVERLVTYLQAGQYKLIKANRSLSVKEQKERLLNSVTAAIRRSLDPEEILQIAVEKLGEGLGVCRCLIYRCQEEDLDATITHEFLNQGIASLKGRAWPLRENPLFQQVLELRDAVVLDNAPQDPRVLADAFLEKPGAPLGELVASCSILSWMLVPILYRDRLLGMMELHHCGPAPLTWNQDDVALVEAVNLEVGVALIQAEAYANLQDLNEQLEALDRTRSNLVAITGHELRTPLSTIQVCLESLATEPDMPQELRQVMLNTALADAERMRKLVQDFLTLSQLESGRIEWNAEPVSLAECIDLSLSHMRAHNRHQTLPQILNQAPLDLPPVQADGEWLVELLAKLLDNAIKFTSAGGQITITAAPKGEGFLEITIADNGRGIEPNRLETVFDRFYQEEGALRRSAGGTGLGLAICRQIVTGWGGEIWAESQGKNLGSQFHFTLPVAPPGAERRESKPKPEPVSAPRFRRSSRRRRPGL
ncbi:MAG: DICT sensory domain-containing protein [Cyanobacteriota bacterium]|jgi:DICT domain-containing protein/signal transduction histidine kinase